MYNQVTLVGRLGNEPDLKSGSNYEVAVFSLATSVSYKNKEEEWQEQTEWHNIKAWGYLAQKSSKLSKGDLIMVVGSIHYDSWESENGEKKYKTEIIASTIKPMSGKVKIETQNATSKVDDIPF